MKSPMIAPVIAIAAAAVAWLTPAVASAGDHSPHPLIGEPPALLTVRTPADASRGPLSESLWMARQKEELVASLVGLRVYDDDRNQLGDVTAVLFTNDGGVDTLLIRIDEASAVDGRDIALPFDFVTTAIGSDGGTVILVDTDGEEIAGAIPLVGVDEIPPTSEQ